MESSIKWFDELSSNRNGEFNKWFDELSSKEFNKMWEDPKLRKGLKIEFEDREDIMSGIWWQELQSLKSGEYQ